MAGFSSNTEQNILVAARKVFIEKGRDGARMQEIANEAGINKALLHYYFRSKQKLFEAVFLEAFDKFLPQTELLISSDKPFFEKLIDFCIKRTSLPREEILVRSCFSKESKMVNTEIIAKMPMVIPSKERKVRVLLTTNSLIANK